MKLCEIYSFQIENLLEYHVLKIKWGISDWNYNDEIHVTIKKTNE